jgi:hypothetical protein
MKKHIILTICALASFLFATYTEAANIYVRDFKMYSNNLPYQAIASTSDMHTQWGCIDSYSPSTCDRIYYTDDSVFQNISNDVDAIYVDYRNDDATWTTNQMWLVVQAGSTNDCGWGVEWDPEFRVLWYNPSETPNRGVSYTNIFMTSQIQNEEYYYYCAWDGDYSFTHTVYPISEITYQYQGYSSYFTKQFGIYLE